MTLFSAGMAPEQIDPGTLDGYYSGVLQYSPLVAGAIAGADPPKGLRETHALLCKSINPDTKSVPVRYVSDLCAKSIAQHPLIGRILTAVMHGGVPGARHIAHPQFRLKHWGQPVEIARLMTSKKSKRIILHAICQFVTQMPCHVVSAIVPVAFSGCVSAAVFTPKSADAELTVTARSAISIETPLSLGNGAAVLAKADPRAAEAAYTRMAVPFGGVRPSTPLEVAALQLVTTRAKSLAILPCHPSVQKYQMDRFGELPTPVCTMCRTVLAPVGNKGKTRRVFPVLESDGCLVCSGCGSDAVVEVDMCGMVAYVQTRAGQHDIVCPCSQCGVLGPIGAVRGLLPFCRQHAALPDVPTAGHCAICASPVHGAGIRYIEVAGARYECICSTCQTIFPVRTPPTFLTCPSRPLAALALFSCSPGALTRRAQTMRWTEAEFRALRR